MPLISTDKHKNSFLLLQVKWGFEFIVILPYDPGSYHERMSESVKKNKSCSCCPYGFHIDVDFLNSLERNRKSLATRNSLKNVGKHFENSKDHVQGYLFVQSFIESFLTFSDSFRNTDSKSERIDVMSVQILGQNHREA